MRCMGCMKEYTPASEICPICGYNHSAPSSHSNHLKPGTMVAGRYLIGKALGSGGFGITYIAWDSLIGKTVAVKEYLPGVFAYRVPGKDTVATYNKESEEKFRAGILKTMDESNTLARFNSLEGVVDVYNCIEANNTVYIIMEYLEGHTLKQELKTHGTYSFEDSLSILAPILNALYQIHESGIIHRDISPDNIFICNDGTVRLIDFGAARMALNDDRKSLSVILKRGYAPKEQYFTNAKQGPWTDVYATAATFYRMLTGVVPQESLEREGQDALIPPSEMGVELPDYAEHAILRALAIEPNLRTKNTRDFYRQLTDPELDVTVDSPATYSDFRPLSEIEEEKPKKEEKKSGNKKALLIIGIIALLMVMAIAGAVIFILSKKQVIDNGTCGESLNWELSSEGELTISGSGLMDDYNNSSDTPWFTDKDKIQVVTISTGVESIGSRAFYGCTSLVKTDLGGTLRSIGSYAFYGCTSLENCVLPETLASIGSYSFSHCTALEYLHIPSSTDQFGVSVLAGSPAYICSSNSDCDAYTFANSSAIEFVECGGIHGSDESIANTTDQGSEDSVGNEIASGTCGEKIAWSFTDENELIISGDARMDGWIIDEETGTWSEGSAPGWAPYAAEVEEIIIDEGVKDIGTSAFSGFTSLKTITIPETLTAIGSNAFMGCTALKSISLPENVTIIGDGAFKDCKSLVNANIDCSAVAIGQYTFNGCISLSVVTLPQSLQTIGNYAFAECTSLAKITIPTTVLSIGEYSFMNCKMINSLTFAYGLTDIPKGAFAGCGITTFDIPSSVETVGEYAFSGCESLESVSIPNSVTVIGQGAFGGCTALKGVIIPSSVKSIGAYAFSNCTSLEYVHIPSNVSVIGESIIDNTNAEICSDSILSNASSYATRNGYNYRICSNQH